MSIRTTVHESLPYIDPEPTPTERAAAESLITSELALSPPSSPTTHPSQPPAPTPNFSPLINQELSRIASKQPLNSIDLSRYEAQPDAPTNADELPAALARAYATSTYLHSRHAHLHLLQSYGKNAWLVGNWELEHTLAGVERELAGARREVDVVNLGRKHVQDEVGAELRGLEDAWRRGVGRVLEVEVAAEGLRREVLERQRGGG
ncbi:Pre-mRNA-splicing factor SPF27 [Whalleya microplaca]|nr:Pre-mRNA-splicing factor SPF27 [Whalleya microplaca]